MSRKAVIVFSIWTAFFSALFNSAYSFLPDLFARFGYDGFSSCNWVMFVCLAVYFGMGLGPKDAPSAVLSAFCGMIWGQVDFLLTDLFAMTGMGGTLAMFLAVLVGTAITMVIHIHVLKKTPFRFVPFVFAGVCLTFSQGGGNVVALGSTFVIGIALCAICTFMMFFASKKWPETTQQAD
jgi:hypothetical protein